MFKEVYTNVSGLKRGAWVQIEDFWSKIESGQDYVLKFKVGERNIKNYFTLRRIGKPYPDPQLFELTIHAPFINVHRCCLVVNKGTMRVYAWTEKDVYGYPSCNSLSCWKHASVGTSLKDDRFFCEQDRFRGCFWVIPFIDRGSEAPLSIFDAIYYACANLMHTFALESKYAKRETAKVSATPAKHIRREHVRHLKDGKIAIVRSTVVSNPKKN